MVSSGRVHVSDTYFSMTGLCLAGACLVPGSEKLCMQLSLVLN